MFVLPVLGVLGVLGAGAFVVLLEPDELGEELEPDELGDELEPEAELELPEPALFIAVSNSWRLTEPSWFASTLVKSRLELDEDLLPPLAEVDCLLFCFMPASHSWRLSLPSWFESSLLKSSFWVELALLEPPEAALLFELWALVLPEVALLSLFLLVVSLA